MTHHGTVLITVILLLTALTAETQANNVVGSASVSVFGAVPKEIEDRARLTATAHFSEELQIWLRQEMHIGIDTSNTIRNYALRKLVERCLKNATESTTTRGRIWTLSLTLSESAVRSALQAHNSHYDTEASRMLLTANNPDPNAALPATIGALCAAMAKIEPTGASRGVNVNEVRASAQELLDRVRVSAPNTVIEGRPGSLPHKAPLATFTIDSIPLTGLNMVAFVQNGREFTRVATDSRGELPMKNYKVPFVHNGSMLTVSPDARSYINADRFIRYRDLGLRLNRGQELSFIFKIPTLTYTLDFKVFTHEPEVKIPPEFSNDAHVRKYLKDACGLVPATGGAAPDLRIRIGAQITKELYNELEEDGFKMTMRAEFQGAGINKVHQEVFEKRQRFGLSFQTGAYFVEASGAIREMIINALAKD